MIKRTIRSAVVVICGILFLAPALVACEEEKGPAEKLGEKIDQTVEEGADKVEEAADELEEKAE